MLKGLRRLLLGDVEQKLEDREGIFIVFLDVDGVLNTTKNLESLLAIEQSLVQQLVNFIVSIDGQVVLSSSWRSSDHAKQLLLQAFQETGFVDDSVQSLDDWLLGQTEALGLFTPRCDEILVWLRDNTSLGKNQRDVCVSGFICLDDMDLLSIGERGFLLEEFFVKTHPSRGFDEERAQQAWKLANRNFSHDDFAELLHQHLQDFGIEE